jgi:hypothetical protein
MATISPWAGAGDVVMQQIKQRVMDQIAEQQRQFQNSIAARSADRADQQQQMLWQEHQQAQADRAQQNLETDAAKTAGTLAPDQSIPEPVATKLGKTMQAANMRMNPPLSQPPNMPDMMQPDIVPGQQPGPVWMGTDKQRSDKEQKVLRGRLIANPNLSDRERLFIEMENAGLKVPTNLEPKPGPAGEIKETPRGLVRVAPDNSVTPVMGPDGKQVQAFHPAPQPIVIQTPTGPALVNRGAGTATPIKDSEGNDVGPKTKNVAERLGTTAQQLADMDTALQEAHRLSDILKKAGLDKDNSPFGPRTATILASHGINPGDLPGDITQASKFTKAELMLGLARGSGIRGQQLQQELGAHLPDSIQTGKQLADVLQFIDREYQNKRHNTLRAHGVKDEEYPFEDVYRPQKDNAAPGTVQVGGFTVKVKP